MMARPVDPQRSPDPTFRSSTRHSGKLEPMEATAHLLRKQCPSRLNSPAWEASGLHWSSLDSPVGSMQALRPSAQHSWSPEPSVVPDQAWEDTALHQKKLCPLSLTSLPREAAVNFSYRSQTLLQEAQVLQGSPELLPRSPKPSGLQRLAPEEATALPLRRLCHLSLMEKDLGTTAHPRGFPELSHKSTAAASSRQSRPRVRSASLPPRTRLPSGSQAPSAAHPKRLSDLLLTSRAAAPGWRSPDPRSRLAAPPLGSTTLPSTWTAPQSRLTARPSRSPEPQIRESEQRDPQLRRKQQRWKEPLMPRREEKYPLRGTDPLPPGQPQRIPLPGQPLQPQPILTPGQPQKIPTPGQHQPILTPGHSQPIPTPGQPLPPQPIPTPGRPLTPQPIPTPGRPLTPQPIQMPGRPLRLPPPLRLLRPGQPMSPQLRQTQGLPLPQPLLPPGQPKSAGRPLQPLPPGPDARSISDPPAPRSRLPIRLLRGLLARLPGGASPRAAAAAACTTMKGWPAATMTPAETSPTMGPPDASAGFSIGEIAAAESPSATYSATFSCKPSGAASVDLRVPSPKPRALSRSRRYPWRRSADRCAKKPWRSGPRSAQRRNAVSSSTNNSRTKRWATCVRTACCF
ncbi:protein ALEX isoform Alex [Homo sapiens]|uniref:Protein ALEX n=2 Tax=Homo sapiens TaxID=9606 RepID=ALEX_HUMAN|nr:protein ALEX isoform Alex [Homo sapiens]NP_001296812.1 protein ALEX isoform Alex [Homo sapiens]P84996.1 RecName: Full=Protein ALEX; AltName: Full=Alternative gene product encoded by XL-exon [Homo sapiens]|eukprot:NP_001070958.1 protein ALEX isoform Alex [Homo sapiens]